MADYNINAITRRRVFTGSAGVGPYAFTFEILNQDDLAVYFNETKLTITTDYTVTINANGTGSVTLVVNVGGNVPQTPVGSDQIIVVGARDIERVTDFVTAGDLLASSLNEQLDALTIFDQQLAEEGQRSMRAPVYDPALVADGGTLDMTLPAKADRVDAVLAFDTNGNPIKGPTVSGITTMTALATDITTLADIEDGTVATDAISDTATVVSDIPTVAGIASNVTTVAGVAADVTTVANNITEVTTFSQVYRVGATDPTSNNDVGDLFYNTTSDTLKVWQGAAWVIAASEIAGYLPVTGGTITGDLTLSGGSGNDILFDQSRKILHFKDGTKAAFGLIPSSSANPNTADIEIYRNNLEGAVIGFADTSPASGTKIPNYIKNLTADVNYIQFTPTQDVALFYNGVEKFATENTGVGVIGDINVSGLVDGRDVAADGTKLDGIEASADVTDAGNVNPLVDAHLNQSTAASGEVLSWNGSDYDWIAAASGGGDLLAANNLSDLDNTTTARTNLGVAIGSDVQAHSSVLDSTTASFTTAKDSKLTGIEAGATADQTGAEIKAAYEAEANAFTDAQFTKLAGIEAGATADQSDAEIKTAYENNSNTNAFTDAEKTKLTGIEAGATADQTAAEIRAAVEAATDSNVFTDADHTKLDGIAAGATAYGDSDVDTHLNTSTAGTNEVLSWTGSDYDWVAQSGGGGGISSVVEDTTPQLGGDLDVNSKAINFGDSNGTTTNMLTFGAGGDLKIYHHATAGTYITENGTGNLNLLAGDLRLMNGAGSTTLRSQLSGIQISNSYTLPTADGTSGQVMTTDGAGTVSFTTVSGGGGGAWNLISTTTVTSNVSTVDFTSIGTYKRYVLKWDCTMNSAAIVAIKIYDNGSLVTSSDYVGMRGAMASYLAVQTTSTRWLTSTGMTTQIGHLEISAVEPRLPFRMEVAGLSGTGDSGDISFSTGGLKSTYSLTSFSGLQLGTTGTNDIATGRFALYGLSQ